MSEGEATASQKANVQELDPDMEFSLNAIACVAMSCVEGMARDSQSLLPTVFHFVLGNTWVKPQVRH